MALALPLDHLAKQYLLDPDIVFLNHGSFGAVPRPVFESYQRWQRELESNPVNFLGRRAPDLLAEARERLGAFINASASDLAFVPNVTYGLNIVARSLHLEQCDEILSTAHEYGAIDRTWRFNCEKLGARLVSQPIAVPVADPADVVSQIWAGVNERTKVISLSHITSPTALILPVAEICRRAREAGILTVVDGAHAPASLIWICRRSAPTSTVATATNGSAARVGPAFSTPAPTASICWSLWSSATVGRATTLARRPFWTISPGSGRSIPRPI